MLFACWAAKGGAGATVVSCSLAVALARSHPVGVLLVDLGGDVEAVLGSADSPGDGLVGWLARAEAGESATAEELAALEVAVDEHLALLPWGRGPRPPTARSPLLLAALARDERAVVVDCGTLGGADGADPWALALAGGAAQSLLVTRLCYLALRRAARAPLRPSGAVVVAEPGRALRAADVASLLGAPVVAELAYDPAVARAVDAGLLRRRLPAPLARLAGVLVG